MSFPSDTPVLELDGLRRDPPPGGRWILWPAWCWRVLAPDLAERRLDAFSRLIARLCQAGITEPAELAKRTRLHRDLCNQVLLMLQQQKLVDRRGNLTGAGQDVLAGESLEASRTRLVHVFQDPFDAPTPHRLWPATVETLGYAQVDYRSGGRPWLRLGPRWDSPSVEPVVARARGLGQPPRPSPAEVVGGRPGGRARRPGGGAGGGAAGGAPPGGRGGPRARGRAARRPGPGGGAPPPPRRGRPTVDLRPSAAPSNPDMY
ncbi:hypothetical protein AB0L22_18585 [Micromonospora haikouensis]|uniref:hypothetical protein n=1 Tax=Micromonospora haikouensis TaxID=686309 RepID=UPI003419E12D